jgi:hypothetical protein
MVGIPLWYRAHKDLILSLVKKESAEAKWRRGGQESSAEGGQESSAEGGQGQERWRQQGKPAQNPGMSAQRPAPVRI